MILTEEKVLEFSRALIHECLEICEESYQSNNATWNDAVRHIHREIKERFMYE